jgi:hypothetical protein
MFVRDDVTVLQGMVDTASRNLGEVHEDARATFVGQNEPESVFEVEPLDETTLHFSGT